MSAQIRLGVRAKLTGPFVLVGSSVGGLVGEMFARTYPERVAGIAFVDAANSLTIPRIVERRWTVTALACTAGMLSRFGVMRVMDPFGLGADTEGGRRSAAIEPGHRTVVSTMAGACVIWPPPQSHSRTFKIMVPARTWTSSMSIPLPRSGIGPMK